MVGPPALTSPLAPVILRYLTLKTTLGRGDATERRFFQSLDAFLVADHAADLTSEGFDRWCQTHAHLTSGIRRAQMRMVRHLCLYRRRTEPACFVPDLALFPLRHQSAPPSLLTEDEMARVLTATTTLRTPPACPLRGQAGGVGLVLLSTAGLRRGELLRLTMGDYDPQEHTLRVQASKCHTSRLLPLSADAGEELAASLAARRTDRPDATRDAAPLMWTGGPGLRGYTGSGCARVFRTRARQAGIRRADGQPPRVHDLRHSFAVNALLRWYRTGVDVHAKLPLLSTSMGHVSIASTQDSLHFIAPVAHAASERFAQHYSHLLTPPPEEEHP